MTLQYSGITTFITFKDLVKCFADGKNVAGWDLVTIQQPSVASSGVTLPIGEIVTYDGTKYVPSVFADIAAGTIFGVVTDTLTVHATETKTTRAIISGKVTLDYDIINNAMVARSLSVAHRQALIDFLATKNIRVQRG